MVPQIASPLLFATYASGGKWKPQKHLAYIDRKITDALSGRGSKRLIVTVPPRHGKLVAHDTPVLTTLGWVNHGDLVPGDYVYHPSGRPVKVTHRHEPDFANVKVTFTDGSSVVVHDRHEWQVLDRSCHKVRVVETKEFLEGKLHDGPKGKRGGRFRYQLPFVEPLQN